MPRLRARTDAAPQQGGKEYSQDLDRGGVEVNKKTTRIIALALVVIMILALVASMIAPYV